MLKVLLQNLDAWPESALGALCAQEQQEAAAMMAPQDARRKAAARAWLRTELGHQLNMPPHAVPIRRSRTGKPMLEAPLAFNLSHSGAWAALVLLEQPAAQGCTGVGVDIETWSQADNLWDARGQFLHPAEIVALAHLPPTPRDRQSLICWTRKEAVLKAWGVGLTAADLTPHQLQAGTSEARCAVQMPGSPWGDCLVVSCSRSDLVLSVAWQGTAPLSVAWP